MRDAGHCLGLGRARELYRLELRRCDYTLQRRWIIEEFSNKQMMRPQILTCARNGVMPGEGVRNSISTGREKLTPS